MRGSDDKTYDQRNIVGTALSWTPENWTYRRRRRLISEHDVKSVCELITLPAMRGVWNILSVTLSVVVPWLFNHRTLWATALNM